ncbi:WD40 repeat domain-containing protein, partial [Bacteroidota bacterium]
MSAHPLKDLILVGYNNGDIAKIDLTSGNYREVVYQNPKSSKLYSIAYSHFGNYIAVGEEDGLIMLWQADDLTNPLATLPGHVASIRDLKFSRDGKQLVSASMDKTVRVWNMDDMNQQPIVLSDHADWVWSVTFGNQDSQLYAGCKDGVLRKWPTRVDMMAEYICNNVSRNMTLDEWSTYVAEDIEYETTCPALTSSE